MSYKKEFTLEEKIEQLSNLLQFTIKKLRLVQDEANSYKDEANKKNIQNIKLKTKLKNLHIKINKQKL